jgi:hypothetical protein
MKYTDNSQKMNIKGQKMYEEMLSIFVHKVNENQQDIEILPHSSQNGYHQ